MTTRDDRVGLVLMVALGGWIMLFARDGPGRAALLGLLAATTIVVWASMWLTRLFSWAVPTVVAVTPVVIAVMSGRGLPPDGPLPYPNASASLLFLGGAGALMIAARAQSRALRMAAVFVYIAYAVMPLAIGSLAAGAMALLLPLGLLARRRPSAVRVLVVAGVAGVVVALAATAWFAATYDVDNRDGPLHELANATLSERRPLLWSEALQLMRDDPETGVGVGAFSRFSPMAIQDSDAAWAHNEYLQVAAEAGVVGLALSLALLTWVLLRPWWGPRDAAAGVAVIAVGGVAVHASIDYILHFPSVPLAAAGLFGAGLVGIAPAPDGEDEPAGVRRGRDLPLVLPSLTVVLLLVIPTGPLNPAVYAPNSAELGSDGLQFSSPGLVRTVDPPRQLYEGVAVSEAFTLEAWIRTASTDQRGPARIVTASAGPHQRNFTMAQDREDLVIHVRTSRTDPDDTRGDLRYEGVLDDMSVHYLAVTVDGPNVLVYIDGELETYQSRNDATVSNWDHDYPLVFGNEHGGRWPWVGTIRGLVMHDGALSAEQIRAHGNDLAEAEVDSDLLARATAHHLVRIRPRSVWSTLVDVDKHQPLVGRSIMWADVWNGRAFRIVGLAGVFVVVSGWAILTGRAVRRGERRWRPFVVIAAGIVLACCVEALQFLQLRRASLVDVLVAAAGSAVGATYALHPRTRHSGADEMSSSASHSSQRQAGIGRAHRVSRVSD